MSNTEPAPKPFDAVLTPARESRVFGKKMLFERTTALGFSPDTVMRAASGLGMAQLGREKSYAEHLAMHAWVRSQQTGSRLHEGTLQTLERALNPFEDIGRPLTPDELAAMPNRRRESWRLLFRSLRRQFGPVHRRLLVRLALYDRAAYEIMDSRTVQTNRRRRAITFLPSEKYWSRTNFALPAQAIAVLDSALQHLAWLDVQLSSNAKPLWAANPIVDLTYPTKRPMRHWFDILLLQTNCKDLGELAALLVRRRVVSRDRVITHQSLRLWASTQELMPHHAVRAILDGCKLDQEDAQLQFKLWFARFLTFLCELITSFSAEPVDDTAAQKALHERLVQLCAEFRTEPKRSWNDLYSSWSSP